MLLSNALCLSYGNNTYLIALRSNKPYHRASNGVIYAMLLFCNDTLFLRNGTAMMGNLGFETFRNILHSRRTEILAIARAHCQRILCCLPIARDQQVGHPL